MITDESSWLQFALHNYDNPHLMSLQDFEDDVRRFSSLLALFNRYVQKGELRERLIINHLTVLFNVFGVPAATTLLYHKIPKECHKVLNAFLFYFDAIQTNTNIDLEAYDIIRKL